MDPSPIAGKPRAVETAVSVSLSSRVSRARPFRNVKGVERVTFVIVRQPIDALSMAQEVPAR
jgi:hypothetical protein